MRARVEESRRDLAKIGRPVDKFEWNMTPPTVNAYYNALMNDMNFPAGVLLPPLFDMKLDDAPNYGNTGGTIGHELTHGFDDEGRKFDPKGVQQEWWSKDASAKFDKVSQCIVDQYSKFTIPSGEHVNGKLTLGENIGDLGGLAIAHAAYRIALEEADADGSVEGGGRSVGGDAGSADGDLTGDQRFFWSWAQAWRTKARDEEVIRLLAIDPHSPPEFRCNGVVRNIDGFHEAFATAEGDDLWLAPDQRVRIW